MGTPQGRGRQHTSTPARPRSIFAEQGGRKPVGVSELVPLRRAAPRTRQATHHPRSQPWGCAGRSRLPNALYLCRPLFMKHTSPQLLSPSSFSISASAAASMVPATGSGDLTGGQHWVGDPGTRLLGARWYSPGVGGGARTLPPTDAGTFPPGRCRKAGGPLSKQVFAPFYGICGAALGACRRAKLFRPREC